MVHLTLNFNQYDPLDEIYNGNNWIMLVNWRDINHLQLVRSPGVYTIDDGTDALYAGQAQNIRARFGARQEVLREFRFRTVSIAAYHVFAASVVAIPKNYANKIDLAERWLIRFLYLRDGALPNRMLQNINLTGPMNIPPDGLNIRFDPGDAPAYVNVPTDAHYVAANAQSVGYDYQPGVF